ncbi:hypothetical protein Xsto_01042 [Xenorhabdus stockiae]|uniref:5-bromo-4-chloroindolyl phosphate hydrolysis protein n=1 Tax=Xenorhabdus stockiae TaxID=351614 RepID=A0A2D0KSM6_9GAMM|nr:hypothetical protein [Xenorhabdus stockiae]PHM66439.1 hypothetical protein Xsto_01042 [Xenorhabdus stockiae]
MDTLKKFTFRLLVHFIGLMTGSIAIYLTTKLKLWEGNYNSSTEGFIALSNYIGLVALWPPHSECNSNTRQSIIIVLLLILCAVANLLPIFLLFAGMTMLLIKFTGKNLVKGERFFLLIIGYLIFISGFISNLKLFSIWFCIIYVVLVVVACKSEQKKINEEMKCIEDEIKKSASETAKIVGSNSNQKNENILEAFKEYRHQLALVMMHKTNVPSEIGPYLDIIEEKTYAIITCMEEDERDIPQGTVFLNRYLPMIRSTVESLATLKQHQASSSQFQEANLLAIQSLQEMSIAFSEMHQNLLDNNVDDLMADLKSMNQLVRSQGFELKK